MELKETTRENISKEQELRATYKYQSLVHLIY